MAQFIIIDNHLINADEILYAYNDAIPGANGEQVSGVRVEFRHKGVIFLPGITKADLHKAIH